ncbi:MAG: 4Fe-4S binding protein, partial [Candidatus Caldatribacteriaceae bacterium]
TLDTGKIIDFSQFQNLVIQKRLRGKTVVFLVSQKNHSQKEWENMFLLSYALAKEEKAQVWVLLEEVMVARNSLEKKYREARSEGVLFEKIKMERLFFQPTTDMRGVWITFDSERDRYHLTIRADWAVYIPERECLPFSAISWWKDGVPVENFYQLENPNLPSFSSFLDGVFYFSQFDRDSLPWLAQTIDEYLTKGKIALPESSTIDEEKCVLCLTCFRTCPWKAIEIEGLTRRRKAHINWEQCHLCGICMAMCPASAIGIHSLPSEDFSFILCSEVMGNENSLNRV